MPKLEFRISLKNTKIPKIIQQAIKRYASDWIMISDFYIPIITCFDVKPEELEKIDKRLEAILYDNLPFTLKTEGKILYNHFPLARLEWVPSRYFESLAARFAYFLSRDNIKYSVQHQSMKFAMLLDETNRTEQCLALQTVGAVLRDEIEVVIDSIECIFGTQKYTFTIPKTQFIYDKSPLASGKKNNNYFHRIATAEGSPIKSIQSELAAVELKSGREFTTPIKNVPSATQGYANQSPNIKFTIETPISPNKSIIPIKPATPGNSVTPVKSATPTHSATPGKSGTTDKLLTPSKQVTSATPIYPFTPLKDRLVNNNTPVQPGTFSPNKIVPVNNNTPVKTEVLSPNKDIFGEEEPVLYDFSIITDYKTPQLQNILQNAFLKNTNKLNGQF